MTFHGIGKLCVWGFLFVATSSIATSLVGCGEPKLVTRATEPNPNNGSGADPDNGAQPPDQKPEEPALTYESVKGIFQARCQRCHEAGTRNSVASHADILRIKDEIDFQVDFDLMPRNRTLPSAEKKLILDWIRAGAP